MILIAVILLATGFYVGWNIGANDAANCIGTAVGANIISYKRAVILVAVFVTLGAVLQGHHVMKTIGKGIILCTADSYEKVHDEPPPELHAVCFPEEKLPDLAIFVALASAGIFVTLATFSRIPVSTSQSIVGGVAGVGIGIVGLRPEFFKLQVLATTVGSWIICPVLTMTLAFILYFLILFILRRIRSGPGVNRILAALVVISAAYVAYSLGANDVGNAIGPLLNKYPDHGLLLALMGGIALAVGALTFGKRVTETVGKSITPLDFAGAFSAQFSAAFGVHYFSMLGIPVSTSQAVVGAVIGVGLVKGVKAVSTRRIFRIMIGWFVCPTGAAVFAAVLYRLLHSLIG